MQSEIYSLWHSSHLFALLLWATTVQLRGDLTVSVFRLLFVIFVTLRVNHTEKDTLSSSFVTNNVTFGKIQPKNRQRHQFNHGV